MQRAIDGWLPTTQQSLCISNSHLNLDTWLNADRCLRQQTSQGTLEIKLFHPLNPWVWVVGFISEFHSRGSKLSSRVGQYKSKGRQLHIK